jgi:hypothetical protein
MPMTRSDMVKQLAPGLAAVLANNYNAVPEEHKVLFDTKNSDKAFEEEVKTSSLGLAFTKAEGEAVKYDSMQELWTSRYNHETIALAFAITEEAVEDNLYVNYANTATAELGKSLAETKQIKAANVFNNAFSATLQAGGDGVALCSATHPTPAGNQSNTTNTDLSEAALEAALIAVAKYRNDRGILINASPKSLHLPIDLMFVAQRILKSELSITNAIQGATGVTNTNAVNALRSMGYFQSGVYQHKRFTDTTAWFIKTDVTNGAKMFVRKALTSKMEGDFETGNMRYKARERYSFGFSDWRQWFGSSGA